MKFLVSGTTAYDGLEFSFESEVEAGGVTEAKAKAILNQLRGNLYLEWESFDGEPMIVRADIDASEEGREAEVAAFFDQYKGENYIEDWDYGDASAIHRIDQVYEVPRTIPVAEIEKILLDIPIGNPETTWIGEANDPGGWIETLRDVESKLRELVNDYSGKIND